MQHDVAKLPDCKAPLLSDMVLLPSHMDWLKFVSLRWRERGPLMSVTRHLKTFSPSAVLTGLFVCFSASRAYPSRSTSSRDKDTQLSVSSPAKSLHLPCCPSAAPVPPSLRSMSH